MAEQQMSLFGDDDNPNQMSLPLQFEAGMDAYMGGAAPIAPEGGDFEMVDISEEDSTEPDEAPGPPAILSVVPTSTTNPNRPRTLAAGYDHHTKTITVVFRDGTLWNYYGCSLSMWNDFKRAPSKGVFIRLRLDPMGNYGPADTSGWQEGQMTALSNFASRLQHGGSGASRIGYQFKGYDHLRPSAVPKPTYSQRRYREEIRKLMDSGLSATNAVLQARKNLETRTRRR